MDPQSQVRQPSIKVYDFWEQLIYQFKKMEFLLCKASVYIQVPIISSQNPKITIRHPHPNIWVAINNEVMKIAGTNQSSWQG